MRLLWSCVVGWVLVVVVTVVVGRVGCLSLLLMKSLSIAFFRRSEPDRVAREIVVGSVGSGWWCCSDPNRPKEEHGKAEPSLSRTMVTFLLTGSVWIVGSRCGYRLVTQTCMSLCSWRVGNDNDTHDGRCAVSCRESSK